MCACMLLVLMHPSTPSVPPGCQRQADEAISDANRQWQRRLRELEEEWQDRLAQEEKGWGEPLVGSCEGAVSAVQCGQQEHALSSNTHSAACSQQQHAVSSSTQSAVRLRQQQAVNSMHSALCDGRPSLCWHRGGRSRPTYVYCRPTYVYLLLCAFVCLCVATQPASCPRSRHCMSTRPPTGSAGGAGCRTR